MSSERERERAEDGSLPDAERVVWALLVVADGLAELRSLLEQQWRADRHQRRRG